MRELDWWDIGKQALRIPLNQWKTLLACISAAGGTALVAIFAAGVGAVLLPEAGQQWFLDRGPTYLFFMACFVFTVIFQWCWMTALWHSTMRHCLTFALQPAFWKFFSLMLLFLLAELAVGGIKALLNHSVDLAISEHRKGYQVSTIGMALGSLGLHAWAFARLMIWPADTVVRRTISNPMRIWRATDGLFWDFIFLTLRIQIPILLVFGTGIGVAMIVFRSVDVVMILGAIGAVYAMAAINAAGLLAFYEVLGKREAPQAVTA